MSLSRCAAVIDRRLAGPTRRIRCPPIEIGGSDGVRSTLTLPGTWGHRNCPLAGCQDSSCRTPSVKGCKAHHAAASYGWHRGAPARTLRHTKRSSRPGSSFPSPATTADRGRCRGYWVLTPRTIRALRTKAATGRDCPGLLLLQGCGRCGRWLRLMKPVSTAVPAHARGSRAGPSASGGRFRLPSAPGLLQRRSQRQAT